MSLKKSFLNEFFSEVTLFGLPAFYLLVVLVLFKFNMVFAPKLFWALIFVEIFCIFIKIIYKKERPIPQPRNDIFNKIDASSFPSVHSARISLLATVIYLYNRDLATLIVGLVLTILVGYSRIYLRRHYFVDVLCGVLLGLLTGLIIF